MTDQPSYPDAIGSFVTQSVRLAVAEREVARLRGAVKRCEALAQEAQYRNGASVHWTEIITAIEGEEPDVPEVRGRDGEVLEGGPAPDQ